MPPRVLTVQVSIAPRAKNMGWVVVVFGCDGASTSREGGCGDLAGGTG